MTVQAKDAGYVRRLVPGPGTDEAHEERAAHFNSDLTVEVDIAAAAQLALTANDGLAACGFMLAGNGFVLSEEEAKQLLAETSFEEIVHPYCKGGELTSRLEGRYVIDFAQMSEAEARSFTQAYQIVSDRVKPQRLANAQPTRAKYWWRFGRPNTALRNALMDLSRFIATTETAKHRFFQFLEGDMVPDHMVVSIATDSAEALGVLSSAIHVTWALAAGGQLEDRPRYNKSICFDSFPFPIIPRGLTSRIGGAAEQLDAHRKSALARDERVTMTGMYNVVERLRSGDPLTPKERTIHELAACGVLKDLHDELDRLVAEAYGWPCASTPKFPQFVNRQSPALGGAV